MSDEKHPMEKEPSISELLADVAFRIRTGSSVRLDDFIHHGTYCVGTDVAAVIATLIEQNNGFVKTQSVTGLVSHTPIKKQENKG